MVSKGIRLERKCSGISTGRKNSKKSKCRRKTEGLGGKVFAGSRSQCWGGGREIGKGVGGGFS